VITEESKRTIVHQGHHIEIEVPGLGPTPFVYLTLLTSMFMHGSIMHLGGNMLFLWIFGDNLESRMGSLRYLAFYMLGGLAATMAHVGTVYFLGGDPQIPCLGASGAISAVMAGYVLLFPDNRVQVLIFRVITEVPAIVAVGMWFLMQILSASLASEGAGGVAYGAHIGGFLAGLPLAILLCPPEAPGAGFNEL
jgi:membrane associated rhomboid family serine protease